MAKYEFTATDAKQLFKDIHTIATSLRTLSELAKKDAAKEEEREALAREAAVLRTTTDPTAMGAMINYLADSVSPAKSVPLEPDPDERG